MLFKAYKQSVDDKKNEMSPDVARGALVPHAEDGGRRNHFSGLTSVGAGICRGDKEATEDVCNSMALFNRGRAVAYID